jgi:hypothetical protein
MFWSKVRKFNCIIRDHTTEGSILHIHHHENFISPSVMFADRNTESNTGRDISVRT